MTQRIQDTRRKNNRSIGDGPINNFNALSRSSQTRDSCLSNLLILDHYYPEMMRTSRDIFEIDDQNAKKMIMARPYFEKYGGNISKGMFSDKDENLCALFFSSTLKNEIYKSLIRYNNKQSFSITPKERILRQMILRHLSEDHIEVSEKLPLASQPYLLISDTLLHYKRSSQKYRNLENEFFDTALKVEDILKIKDISTYQKGIEAMLQMKDIPELFNL